jgi:ribosomal protein L37AE/L43A
MTITDETHSAGSPLAGLPMLIRVLRAAELLGISRSAAYRCAACGDLPTTHHVSRKKHKIWKPHSSRRS